jgi:hypothetical protein
MSIYGMIYDELKAKIEHDKKYNTKIAKSVFEVLDKEGIADIILDNNTFWFESYTTGNDWTNKEYKWLVNYLSDKGYRYLYAR